MHCQSVWGTALEAIPEEIHLVLFVLLSLMLFVQAETMGRSLGKALFYLTQ